MMQTRDYILTTTYTISKDSHSEIQNVLAKSITFLNDKLVIFKSRK